jgi:hypothetical protein
LQFAICNLQFAILLLLAGVALGEESLSERRERLENMTALEKEEILRHQEQFHALPPAEQQRIRQLHEQLEDEADAAQLREVMGRYSQWLSTLPPYRRAELAELKPAKRIERIKQLLQEHTRDAARRLNDKDRAAVVRWMEQYATDHEARFLDTLPENRRGPVAKMTPAMRHRLVMGLLCQRWLSGNPAVHPSTTERETADLRARLSSEARARLASKSPAEQARTTATWLRQAAKQELENRRGEGASLVPGFDEQLADFFEFQLSDEDRDRLLGLPSEEMQQKLREMYLIHMRPGGPGHAKKTPSAAAQAKKTGQEAKTEKPRPKDRKEARTKTPPAPSADGHSGGAKPDAQKPPPSSPPNKPKENPT